MNTITGTKPKTYASSGTSPSTQDYINQMYDADLASQKQSLETNYQTGLSDLDAQKQKNQQTTDANLNRTYVEAAKSAKNYGEVQNAYGLSSGAMAQAKLAQNNQLQSDMTTLRAAQTEADAQIERQRGLLAKEYASAIAKAQADNDMARAQALYQQAKAEEDRLYDQQLQIAQMFAERNDDYSYYGRLFGLSDAEIAALNGRINRGGGGGGGSGSSSRKTSGGGGGDPTGSGTEGNTDNNVDWKSLLDLGKGPLGPQGLADLVKDGDATVTENENGDLAAQKTPSWPSGSAAFNPDLWIKNKK